MALILTKRIRSVSLQRSTSVMRLRREYARGTVHYSFEEEPNGADEESGTLVNTNMVKSAESNQESRPRRESATATGKQVWWRPDPTTGMWMPEDQEAGSLTPTRLPLQRIRSVSNASMDEKAYWNSLEEMPDRHYS
ncbi:hypothetical protein KP509_07G002500 [Ceratopteris richardii]|uniref:Uncharacterized protein n=1 Tax=Ceratopteris richardii TaxID=49495 RepID=A0A8T2UBH9_CERRI|nr:hypothetical protein KP509_07G002500 [Ceratopteris richardii]